MGAQPFSKIEPLFSFVTDSRIQKMPARGAALNGKAPLVRDETVENGSDDKEGSKMEYFDKYKRRVVKYAKRNELLTVSRGWGAAGLNAIQVIMA